MLHYPREVPAMWLDLAHVIAGAEMRTAMPSTRHVYTDVLDAPATPAAAPMRAGRRGLLALQRFGVAFVSALVCLAVPGSAWVVQSLRS
jgi:hypothetical protein